MENTDEDNVPYFDNADWEATCLIYTGGEEDSSGRVHTDYFPLPSQCDRFADLLKENESFKEAASLIGNIDSVAIIELPIHAVDMAIFAQPEYLEPDHYRFWTFKANPSTDTCEPLKRDASSALRLQLMFAYKLDESCEADMSNDGQPVSVSVALAKTTPYPESWPPDRKEPWIRWLQKEASSVLSDQFTSFSVCAFMELNALDFFSPIPLSDEGHFLIIMPRCETHWRWRSSIDSLVFNPLATSKGSFEMIWYDAFSGTRKRTTPSKLWPKKHEASQKPKSRTNPDKAPQWWLHPCILQHKKWLPRTCPICLEDDYVLQDMVLLDCNHHVCKDCFTQYISIQVQEINQYRLNDNPFKCPITKCRQGIRVMGTVKPYLSMTDLDRVRTWYHDLKHPISQLLPQCLDCPEGKGVMRKLKIDDFVVVCNICGTMRCEYCIERVRGGDKEKKRMEHLSSSCNGVQTLKLARRYWRAEKHLQERCEARYPWIKTYAQARIEKALAIRDWLDKKEGQVCPVCSHGVVREEGCFHITCTCGAHFCYECGEELFPPFYGTHHCWENR